MLTAIGIVPATPLLAPELGGGAADELAALRDHAVAAARALAARCDRWTVLGVQGLRETPAGRSLAGNPVGTFAGFGVDVRVSPGASASAAVTDESMPLPLLIAFWLHGAVGADCAVEADLIHVDAGSSSCLAAGHALLTRLEASPQREGVLVVADGPTTLTPTAPGSFDSRAADVHAELQAAFEAGDAAYLARLEEGLCAELGVEGRAPWQMLAGMLGGTSARASGVYSEAPYGVGYYTGLWSP